MRPQPKTTYWIPERLQELVIDRYQKKMTLDAIAAKHNRKYQAVQHALKMAEKRGIRA